MNKHQLVNGGDTSYLKYLTLVYIFEASKEKTIGLFIVWRQLEKYQDEEMEVYKKYKNRDLSLSSLSLSLRSWTTKEN